MQYQYFLTFLSQSAMQDSVVVTLTNTLDDALAQTAQNPATIVFAAETDGSTCTFAGNTFAHPQKFSGNGSANTIIKAENGSMAFAGGNAITVHSLDWLNILYGGDVDADCQNATLKFNGAKISANVFGGARANAGGTASVGAVSVTVTNCQADVSGKAIYGGGYANGGTVSIDSVDLSITNGHNGTCNVYGAGGVNNGGLLQVGTVTTVIDGGTYGGVYNGANVYTGGTGSSVRIDDIGLMILGGTFSAVVGNVSIPRDGASATYGACHLHIEDGIFDGIVCGGCASFGGTVTNATIASSTVRICGGTFNGKVFGGNIGQSGSLGANTEVTGDIMVTVDSSEDDIFFNANPCAASMGAGTVDGDVTMLFTGKGERLHFGVDCYTSCDSEYSYSTTRYVAGTMELVFDNFTGDFTSNFKGPFTDVLTVRNHSVVNMRGARGSYSDDDHRPWQKMEFVKVWNLEVSGPDPVLITDDPGITYNTNNNFAGKTINVSIASDAGSVPVGEIWTVFRGSASTTINWNQLATVTINGSTATPAMEYGRKAWYTSRHKLYLDENYDIRLLRTN